MDKDLTHLSFVKYFLAKSIGCLNPRAAICIREDVNVMNALAILREKKVGYVVITNAEGYVVGIFTERDVLNKIKSDEQLKDGVTEYMTKNPHCELITSSIAHALTLMSEGGYRHIPIIDDFGKPIAAISVSDVVNHITRTLDKYYKELCLMADFVSDKPKSPKSDDKH
ncbi:MAG: CBS domain-containing protein [Deltaproteobacteria bacterium]|nr:CBS domain-containing protein [Deltaproteobacteria bacterium]